jgi:pyruvate,water dikinase
MDIEWARDGRTDELFIVQARPETVQARRSGSGFVHYSVSDAGPVLARGLSVGDAVAIGPVCVLHGPDEMDQFPEGGVLVAPITDPDWVPAMRRAAAVVTDRGGRTSHAAIVSRELGVPAVLGCGDATTVLTDGAVVTVSCASGDEGLVHEGAATVTRHEVDLGEIPTTRTQVMLNLADPAAALRWWRLPADGIGLARMEFVVSEHIRAHPMALVHPERVEDPAARAELEALTADYPDGASYFVDRLASGIATLAAPFHPKPVILRLSDFKTNEYAKLLGGEPFEPTEENPMLGWRGASRYYDPGYRDGFALECRAIRRARLELGFRNVIVMVPFCRTPHEADLVLAAMAEEGLVRGRDDLQVYVMAEIPSNVILAEQFAERFDGFSIGSNDLTQLTLGVDRDSAVLSHFDATDEAVLTLIRDLIQRAHAAGGRKVGFCGQAPSNDPSYARFLVDAGIDSVSVTPDSFLAVKEQIAAAEAG